MSEAASGRRQHRLRESAEGDQDENGQVNHRTEQSLGKGGGAALDIELGTRGLLCCFQEDAWPWSRWIWIDACVEQSSRPCLRQHLFESSVRIMMACLAYGSEAVVLLSHQSRNSSFEQSQEHNRKNRVLRARDLNLLTGARSGENVRRLRLAAGLSQAELAHRGASKPPITESAQA
jgi:hypothetical protein